jgi:hypothetical protein
MKTPVWTELVCRDCAHSTSGRFSFNGKIEVREMRKEATAQGWKFKHGECFCSQHCLDNFEREPS